MLSSIRTVWLVPALVFLAGCVSTAPPPSGSTGDWPVGLEADLNAETQTQILEHADRISTDAVEAERWITPTLEYLTLVRDGRLQGLENRLKSRDSLIRKIYTRWDKDRSISPDEVSIDDAVRYLIVLNDEPPGHTDDAIREILTILEGVGHRVERIKNYWPRGDDYSGINGVLKAPNGVLWELQFHTDGSVEAKGRVHPIYEVYRLPSTPIDEKRQLFDEMAGVWEDVAVPEGILEPLSLHPKEEIIHKPPP